MPPPTRFVVLARCGGRRGFLWDRKVGDRLPYWRRRSRRGRGPRGQSKRPRGRLAEKILPRGRFLCRRRLGDGHAAVVAEAYSLGDCGVTVDAGGLSHHTPNLCGPIGRRGIRYSFPPLEDNLAALAAPPTQLEPTGLTRNQPPPRISLYHKALPPLVRGR